MELTGKCKEAFEKWLIKTSKYWGMEFDYCFEDLYESMQYQVYIDFFESGGMMVFVKPIIEGAWGVYVDNFRENLLSDYVIKNTSKEARKAAIEKANEIYNTTNP